jgi:SAM-dependent methyltransferase
MEARPTERFSSRVEDYVKYRPGYPPSVVKLLQDECGLTSDSVIADVGSGTGILSELFLRNGNRVYGVEPNREMREAGARLLKDHANFVSVDGAAEATTLEDASVDFVTAGQAFHWFDPAPTRAEFARILRPGGWVVVIWNDRPDDGSPLLKDYERLLLTYGTDYREVSAKYMEATLITPFFEPGAAQLKTFHNQQSLDFDGLSGRLKSASYTPEPGHPNFQPMFTELRSVFDRHQVNGEVVIEYVTKVYYGRIEGSRRRAKG